MASIEGEGSTFTVILPLHDPRKEPTPSSNEPARKQATVLIVEDDSHLLEGLEELLDIFDGKYRLNTLTAKNGVEGLSQLTQRKPHLIISDIMMPKMGGFEFIERVRQMEEFIQIPFIFLTAKGERRDVVNGIVLGAEEYITKPYDSDRLLDLIVAQLDKYFQRQGLITQNFESLKRSIIQLMSPDFHNPIAIVAEHTQEVLGQIENANTDSELKVSLHKIRQGSTQLNQLVKYFIALAELTTDEARIAFDYQANSIANVSQLVREAVSIVTYQTSESELILTSTIQPNLPSIFGVAETVSDCIQKMIRFVATHYLATDRQVHLTAQQANDAIHVTISTDAQLAPKNLQSIEELLAHKRQVKVDLLGHDAVLWIVQGHLALHNGRIQINNTPHLTITLNFPIATD